MKKVLENKWVIASLLIPGMVLFAFAVIIPIIYSVYLGSTDWKGIGKANFVGIENYIEIMTDDRVFVKSVFNAMLLGFVLIVLQHPFAIFMAALVDKVGGRWERIFRTIFFIPCVISIVVTAKMWVSF